MHFYNVEIIDKRSGEVIREVLVEASSAKVARFVAFANHCTGSLTVGHAYREDWE